jgi:hypothetical protein
VAAAAFLGLRLRGIRKALLTEASATASSRLNGRAAKGRFVEDLSAGIWDVSSWAEVSCIFMLLWEHRPTMRKHGFLLFQTGQGYWCAVPPRVADPLLGPAGWSKTRDFAVQQLLDHPDFQQRASVAGWRPRLEDFEILPVPQNATPVWIGRSRHLQLVTPGGPIDTVDSQPMGAVKSD